MISIYRKSGPYSKASIIAGIIFVAGLQAAVAAGDSEMNLKHFPQTRLYPDYIANPLRSTFSVQRMSFDETDIADSSQRRDDLKIGGKMGVVRLPDKAGPQHGLQLTVEAGFHAQFDPAHSSDNIGWDGVYAFMLEMRSQSSLAHKLGIHHVSSHVGDEYAERTGRLRINYTRLEARYGLAWSVTPHWLTYGEAGFGYDLRNEDLQEPWRIQLGMQYESPWLWWKDLGWYAAMDLSSYEESDWDVNAALQIGYVIRRDERRWRMGLELYNGRSQISEFFQNRERYIGFAVWIDI